MYSVVTNEASSELRYGLRVTRFFVNPNGRFATGGRPSERDGRSDTIPHSRKHFRALSELHSFDLYWQNFDLGPHNLKLERFRNLRLGFFLYKKNPVSNSGDRFF